MTVARKMLWRCTVLEDLDDDHAATTAGTTRLAGIDSGTGRLALRLRSGEQLTRVGDVVGARAFGEQAIVADGMQAFWQDVDEEAADELIDGDRHHLGPVTPLAR